MNHIKNKVEWCLKKAEKEGVMHRGLVKTIPDPKKATEHIIKAEHYLTATLYLKQGNFSDISASTAFYAMYHCLLAIGIIYGYESRNQECTFALIYNLIEDKKIDLDKKIIEKISSLDVDNKKQTIVSIREQYQYGVNMKLKDQIYEEMFELTQKLIIKTKEIIEEPK